jgi:hypothetical protein
MKDSFRSLIVAILAVLFIPTEASQAQTKTSWDGTWSGAWGGIADTSVTILGNKVVSYIYKGAPVPVGKNKVAPTTVSFGTNRYHIGITRMSGTTASAQYHSLSLGDAVAILTKQ